MFRRALGCEIKVVDPPDEGGTVAVPDGPRRLPWIALAASVVVGPAGALLGVWSLVRTRRNGAGKSSIALAAVVVGVIQTILVGSWLATAQGSFLTGPKPGATVTATPSVTYPTTPPPSGPTGAVPTVAPPTAGPTSLEQVPDRVDTYHAGEFTPDEKTVQDGAVAAKTGSYTSPQDTIDAAFSQWPTPEAAAAHAEQAGIDEYGADALRASGDINNGQYWYYELNGRGTVYWTQGNLSSAFTGKPRQVQEFFLRFPK